MEYIILSLILAQTTYLSYVQVSKNKSKTTKPVFIDTSVLIDGRIKSLVETGFFPGTITIPRSVVGELQMLADNGDSDKRARARYGLDLVKELQSIDGAKVVIFSDSVRADEGVDNRLLELAKKYNGSICTIDYNLNKVAQVEGVNVLNVNDIAKSLRMDYLPGEKTYIEITQKGNDGSQGVGHLPDGTMVVVENSKQYIGKAVEVEFVRGIQTSAGKMMFAKVTSSSVSSDKKKVSGTKARSSSTVVKKDAKQSKASSSSSSSPKLGSNSSPRAGSANSSSKPNSSSVQKRSSRNRRVTPEDRLVDLANS